MDLLRCFKTVNVTENIALYQRTTQVRVRMLPNFSIICENKVAQFQVKNNT